MSAVKSVALFLASPFIGLAYLLIMPLVALAALLWIGAKALARKLPASKALARRAERPLRQLLQVVDISWPTAGFLVGFEIVDADEL